ncbi:hypothetical protein HDU98_011175 [Podochytrium sp. JEL0797]|nr:hypothetical protein HDU98_011175 [Podochytrium sp. JEL0797]
MARKHKHHSTTTAATETDTAPPTTVSSVLDVVEAASVAAIASLEAQLSSGIDHVEAEAIAAIQASLHGEASSALEDPCPIDTPSLILDPSHLDSSLPAKRCADQHETSQKKLHKDNSASLSGLNGPFLFEQDSSLPRVDSKLGHDDLADPTFQAPLQVFQPAPYSPVPFSPSLETLKEEDQTPDLLLPNSMNITTHVLPSKVADLLSIHLKPLVHRAIDESALLQLNHAFLWKVFTTMCFLTFMPIAIWLFFVSFPLWVAALMLYGYPKVKQGVVVLGQEVRACLEV